MNRDNSGTRARADSHFKQLRDAKTAGQSKKLEAARVKTDSDKSSRLRATRLAKEEADTKKPAGS